MFATLRARAREGLAVGDADNLDRFAGGALRFGFGPRADIRGEHVELGPASSRFRVGHTQFELPVPGAHNVANALAAIAACRVLDLALADMVGPLAGFAGIGRRFQVVSISHPPHRPGHVTVAYRDGMRLRIPVGATNLAPSTLALPRSKLTRAALLDLVAALKECEASCPDQTHASGPGPPTPSSKR